MFDWLRLQILRKEIVIRSEEMQQLADLLFPPLKTIENGDDVFQIDYSADSNLDAVLMDLQDGNNDPASHKTLIGVIKRLNKARKILRAYAILDLRSKYLIVDNPEENDEITARD
jgi:hypothetical protein